MKPLNKIYVFLKHFLDKSVRWVRPPLCFPQNVTLSLWVWWGISYCKAGRLKLLKKHYLQNFTEIGKILLKRNIIQGMMKICEYQNDLDYHC